MHKNLLLALLVFAYFPVPAQPGYKPSYKELQRYEGRYAYINNTSLVVAASPRDTILYAIIDEVKYPLRAVSEHKFLNPLNDEVLFLGDSSGQISGYRAGGGIFRILDSTKLDTRTWYAKRPNKRNGQFDYSYTKPATLPDGISIGNIDPKIQETSFLKEMTDKIWDRSYPNIHSVLVVKHNELVFEEYFYEYDIDIKHQLRSATKSFISALAGVAIDKRFIKDENQPVISYFPEYSLQNNSPFKNKITIKHLLANQTGLDCDIDNPKSAGNETAMSNSGDWVKFTLDLPIIDTPGGKGMYCSGNAITMGRIIEKASSNSLADFARENLFKPMGITDVTWNFKPDKSSAETFCQLYLRPRDMLKFGMMYMNKGKWNGKQVVPEDWVNTSFKKHSVVDKNEYGFLWWRKWIQVNGKRIPGFAAQGNGGQRIYLFPENGIVVVITGGSYNTQSSSDKLIANHILPAFTL